jgi:methyl-accepting chemotaxis protein
MFSNLKIGAKLACAFVIVVCMTLGLGTLCLIKLSTINANVADLATNWLPTIKVLGAMQDSLNQVRRAEGQHLLQTDPANKTAQEKRLEDLKATLDKQAALYETMITPSEKEVYAQFRQHREAYLASAAKLFEKSRQAQADISEARAYYNGDARAAMLAPMNDVAKLLELNVVGADQAYKASQESYVLTRTWVIFVLAAVVVISAWLGIVVTRAITRPLAQAVQAANDLASGDLTMKLETRGQDETAQLIQAMSNMKDQFARLVQRVRTNAEGVATASSEIAQGNQDLSGRTEQQASALEQTAASMEELGATVKHNADNARTANQMAQSASTVATEGGRVVAEVVETMKDINDSSRRIADIIGVIDGIAFQTNILALNAAVEAARAGEQGRGFAVVASEVRSLASRSADAAKEIKSLIAASVERVDKGSTLVDKAGLTMSEVVSSIRRVNDLMGEISAASNEQSSGVSQVGEAITHMDHATQQNAAMVEQMAAAANGLSNQAQELVSAVSVFRLAPDSASSAAVRSEFRSANVVKPGQALAPKKSPVPGPVARVPSPKPAPAAKLIAKAEPGGRAADRAKPGPSASSNEDWESF